MEPYEEQPAASPNVDIAPQVMQKIHTQNIKMKRPLFILAEKLGLESVLVLMITGAAILVGITLYFLKKTGVLYFVNLGWPGIKVILLTLPYDYITLFIFTVFLANYILGRLDLSRRHKLFFNAPVVTLFVIATLMGAFFGVMGIEQIAKGWSKNQIPKDMAISGKVMDVSGNAVIIADDKGKLTEIFLDGGVLFPYTSEYAKNKFLRAVGRRDDNNPQAFHADNIHCCDED